MVVDHRMIIKGGTMFAMNPEAEVQPADPRSKAIILLSQLILSCTGQYPRPDHAGEVVDALAEYTAYKTAGAVAEVNAPRKKGGE